VDPTSNFEKFAELVQAVVERQGVTLRSERRYRTTPHSMRRAKNRRVNKAAKAARKLNRPNKRHRSGVAPPRERR
jgi:hypothetical protein